MGDASTTRGSVAVGVRPPWRRADGSYDRAAQIRIVSKIHDGRGKHWRGRLSVPDGCHPLVRQLFEIANEQRATMKEIAGRAGMVPYATLSNWRYGNCPQLQNFEAALNALGYELHIRPKEG